jgi:hypothetical protein
VSFAGALLVLPHRTPTGAAAKTRVFIRTCVHAIAARWKPACSPARKPTAGVTRANRW